jgi:hypothetical protein
MRFCKVLGEPILPEDGLQPKSSWDNLGFMYYTCNITQQRLCAKHTTDEVINLEVVTIH